MKKEIEAFLEGVGIKPTANRILVTEALMQSECPLSLTELETHLETMEKSSVFRVLSLLEAHDAIHAVEDGRGVAKYEICHEHGECSPAHYHAHFYCEECRRTFCLDDVAVNEPQLPAGFKARSVNYMIKGRCPDCSHKR